VIAQTYPNIELIVVDNGSSDPEYHGADLGDGVRFIQLEENSRVRLGYATPGSISRNSGLRVASGSFVAFLDDDDVWLPKKIELQLDEMERSGCEMSCTDGYIGWGPYDPSRAYPRYNAEYFIKAIRGIHRRKWSWRMERGFPKVWSRRFLEVHNSAVCSSVVLSRSVISRAGEFRPLRRGVDYDYWLRALAYTDCVYVPEPCFYYDDGHAGGQQY
jgi:glycosyltransferase involved in cell wall biosynthesis